MLAYQLPLYFLLGALLCAFPELARVLGSCYIAIVVYRYAKPRL